MGHCAGGSVSRKGEGDEKRTDLLQERHGGRIEKVRKGGLGKLGS